MAFGDLQLKDNSTHFPCKQKLQQKHRQLFLRIIPLARSGIIEIVCGRDCDMDPQMNPLGKNMTPFRYHGPLFVYYLKSLGCI